MYHLPSDDTVNATLVKDNDPLALKRSFLRLKKSGQEIAARETSKLINL